MNIYFNLSSFFQLNRSLLTTLSDLQRKVFGLVVSIFNSLPFFSRPIHSTHRFSMRKLDGEKSSQSGSADVAQLKSTKEKIILMKQHLEDIRKEKNKNEATLTTYQEKLAENQAILKSDWFEIDEAKKKLKRVEEERMSHQKAAQIDQEEAQDQEGVQEAQIKVLQKQELLQTTKEKLLQAKENLAIVKEQSGRSKETIEKLQQNLDKDQGLIESRQQKLKQMIKDRDLAKKECEESQLKLQEVADAVVQKGPLLEKQDEQLKNLKNQILGASCQLKDRQDALEKRKVLVQQNEGELASDELEFGAVEENVKQAKEGAEKSERALKKVQEELLSHRNRLKEINQKKIKVGVEIREIEETLTLSEEQLGWLQKTIAQVKQQVTHAQSELRKAESNLQLKQEGRETSEKQAIETMRKEMQANQKTSERLLSQVKATHQQTLDIEKELEEIEDSYGQIIKLRVEFKAVVDELQEVCGDIDAQLERIRLLITPAS